MQLAKLLQSLGLADRFRWEGHTRSIRESRIPRHARLDYLTSYIDFAASTRMAVTVESEFYWKLIT